MAFMTPGSSEDMAGQENGIANQAEEGANNTARTDEIRKLSDRRLFLLRHLLDSFYSFADRLSFDNAIKLDFQIRDLEDKIAGEFEELLVETDNPEKALNMLQEWTGETSVLIGRLLIYPEREEVMKEINRTHGAVRDATGHFTSFDTKIRTRLQECYGRTNDAFKMRILENAFKRMKVR